MSQNSNLPLHKLLFAGILLLLLVLLLITYWGKNTADRKVLDLEQNVANLQSQLAQADLLLKEEQLKLQYKEGEVNRLSADLSEKNRRIDRLEQNLNDKEDRIRTLERERDRLLDQRSTPDQIAALENLRKQIGDLRAEKDQLITQNTLLESSRDSLSQLLVELTHQYQIAKEVTIPQMELENRTLAEENNRLTAILTMNPVISDFELDVGKNSVQFNLNFSSEDLRLLNALDLNVLTLTPIIQAREGGMPWIINFTTEFDRAFKFLVRDIGPSNRIQYTIEQPKLRDIYKNQRRINPDKSDVIMLEIRVQELENTKLAQYQFYAQPR